MGETKQLGKNVFIASTAIVEDGVSLGDGVKVWHWVQIRPGANIGKGTQIGSHAYIDSDVKIGEYCSLQSKVYVPRGVELGNKVFLGPNVVLTNDKHPRSQNPNWKLSTIFVEDDVSIGANATICPGITLKRGCIIGAGSVVTKDVPEDTIVAGNPARVLRKKKIGQDEY